MDCLIENLASWINRVDKLGLYYGKTGLAYFLQYFPNNDDVYRQLLSDVKAHLNLDEVNDFSFSEGLTGIGWALQMMVEYDKADANYVDIISICDDLIYREVALNKSQSLSLFSSEGILGKTLYFLQRFTSVKNREINHNRATANLQCLILLTTEIKDILSIITINKRLIETRFVYLLEIAQSFIILYLCLQVDINKNFIRPILQYLRVYIEKQIIKTDDIDKNNAVYFFYLLYAYDCIAHDMKESSMIFYSKKASSCLLPIITPFLKNNTDIRLLVRYNIRNNTNKTIIKEHLTFGDTFILWDNIPSVLERRNDISLPDNQNCLRMFLLE